MSVAANEDYAGCFCVSNQVVEPLPFVWEVHPLLKAVIFGDDLTMQYVMTPTTDKILLVPMTYADITGILLLAQHRVRFANKRHRALFTGSVIYIAGSVPLHIYCSYIIWDTLMTWFPMWFSYFLLIVVYPAFLTLFWRLQYRN